MVVAAMRVVGNVRVMANDDVVEAGLVEDIERTGLR